MVLHPELSLPSTRSPLLSSLTIQTPSACTQVLHHRRGTWLLSWEQKKQYSPQTAVHTTQRCSLQSHPGRGEPGRGCPVPAGHASQAECVARRGACQVRMRAESLVRKRALLHEAKELVFPKWSCSAGQAVCCLPCNLQHLGPSHSIPSDSPATIPQLARPSVFFVSRKRSCWQQLAAPSSRPQEGPGPPPAPLWALCYGLRKEPCGCPSPTGPRAIHGFFTLRPLRGSSRWQSSPLVVFLGSARSAVSQREAAARFAPAWQSDLPRCWKTALVLGFLR